MTGQAAEGSTPAESGLKILPYSLGSSLASMPVAWFIGYWQRRACDTSGQNNVISIGLFISTLGFGKFDFLSMNHIPDEATYRTAHSDGRKHPYLFANTVSVDLGGRYRDALSLSLPGVSKDAGPTRGGLRDKCILLGALYRSDNRPGEISHHPQCFLADTGEGCRRHGLQRQRKSTRLEIPRIFNID